MRFACLSFLFAEIVGVYHHVPLKQVMRCFQYIFFSSPNKGACLLCCSMSIHFWNFTRSFCKFLGPRNCFEETFIVCRLIFNHKEYRGRAVFANAHAHLVTIISSIQKKKKKIVFSHLYTWTLSVKAQCFWSLCGEYIDFPFPVSILS